MFTVLGDGVFETLVGLLPANMSAIVELDEEVFCVDLSLFGRLCFVTVVSAPVFVANLVLVEVPIFGLRVCLGMAVSFLFFFELCFLVSELEFVEACNEGNCSLSDSAVFDVNLPIFLFCDDSDGVDDITSFDGDEDSYRIKSLRSGTIGCGDVISTYPKLEMRSYFSGL